MVRKTYGKTWWGQKWLDTFNGIDDENRLPRGRTYANKGAVSNIKILGNVVTAKVQGSRLYKVQITFEAFSQKQKDILLDIIEKSPSILSALLNKRLSQKLYDELLKVEIKLLPTRWKDVKASCSCPDYAVPCKHIAAVLYLICDEIDKNPFVLFDLHGCNILELIKGFDAHKLGDAKKITTIEELFSKKKSPKPRAKPNVPEDLLGDTEHRTAAYLSGETQAPVANGEALVPVLQAPNVPQATDGSEALVSVLQTLNLSRIPNLEATTLSILKSDAVFYEKNFLEKIKAFYDLIGTPKYDLELDEEAFLKKHKDIERWNTFEIALDDQHKIAGINLGNKKNNANAVMPNLFDFFREIPNASLHLLNPNLRFLHMVFQFTSKLMERRALIPQILQNSPGETFVRWIPAVFNDEVRKVIDGMALACPSIIKGMNNAHEQINSLVALFVASKRSSLPLTKLSGDTILDMFFDGKAHKFTSFSQKEIPGVINQWLSNLYLTKKAHKLYLEITDKDESFQLDLKVIPNKQDEPVSLQKAFKNVSASTKFDILSDISALAEHLPELEDIIDNNKPVSFAVEDFTQIFLSILPVLKSIGVFIALPKSLREVFSPKLTLNMSSKKKIADSGQSFLNLESILNFDWSIAVGDQNLTAEEFKKLMKKTRWLVRFANNYVLMDEKKIEAMLKQFDSLPRTLSHADMMQAALAEEYESAAVVLDQQLMKLFSSIKEYKARDVPANLNAQLRPYQERGFSWLVQNIDIGFGSILADDMGLGKTLQVIAAILHLKNNGALDKEKVLVIAPTSLLTNWNREIARFAPSLNTHIYHGNKRELNGEFDIALTSYGLAYRDKKEFQKHDWFLLVIDEAQNIKNPLTLQTKAVKSIEAKHKIAMSGTPVENRLLEYWSIFDFTNKNYLGTHGNFRKKFSSPIERERDKDCLDRFIKVTSPFILRRCKNDKSIIEDLPEKLENNRYCSLTKEQAAIYQEILDTSMAEIEASEGINRKGLVLKLINSLKQICNHPSHYGKKSNALLDQSGKSKMLEEILTEIHDLGEKTLIFTQYVDMGNILMNLLEERFKLPVPFLHGGLSRENRDGIVTDFQENSQTRTLILSLKAGGTGLNLTAANHVVHYDLWWNPAVEAQATDRAYRIGQKSNVVVHRLITTGTFEERIDEMIQSKKDLANLTVSSGEKWITEFDNDQLKDLMCLRQV